MDLQDFSQFGLTKENLYKYEDSLPYWQKYPPDKFIREIIHEIRESVFRIQTLVDYVCQDSKISSQTLDALSNLRTVKEEFDFMSEDFIKLKNVLELAWEYADAINPSNMGSQES